MSSWQANSLPVLGADSSGNGFPPALLHHPAGLGRAVSSLATVTTELPAYRRPVHARLSGYLALIKSCFLKSVNLVSLFLGKLRVTSHSAPLLGRLEALMLPQLAS